MRAAARISLGLVLLAVFVVAGARPALAVDAELRRQAASDDWEERRDAAKPLAIENTPAAAKLLRKLIDDEHPEVRDWAIQYCGYLKDERAITALLPLTKAPQEWVRRNGVTALGRTKSPTGAAFLARVVRDERSGDVRAHALAWLPYVKDHIDIEAVFADAMADRDPEVRAAVLLQQDDVRGASAAAMALAACDDPDEGVRCVARRVLRRVDPRNFAERLRETHEGDGWRSSVQLVENAFYLRTTKALDVLVELVADGNARVAAAAHRALGRLTGKRFGRDADLWAAWWKENRAGWVPPQGELPADPAVGDGGTFARYHGIEIASEGVLFALDLSTSMEDRPDGEDSGPTKWDLASAELLSTLEGLPDGLPVNVVFFHDDVETAFPRPRPLGSATRTSLTKLVERARFGTKTNLFGALQVALRMDGVDTVFLLTDGVPTWGEMVHKGRIAPAFWRANRRRRLAVHAIAFGAGDYGTELLRRLSAKNEGLFVEK